MFLSLSSPPSPMGSFLLFLQTGSGLLWPQTRKQTTHEAYADSANTPFTSTFRETCSLSADPSHCLIHSSLSDCDLALVSPRTLTPLTKSSHLSSVLIPPSPSATQDPVVHTSSHTPLLTFVHCTFLKYSLPLPPFLLCPSTA